MNILITKDDGKWADGIIELGKQISKEHNVYIISSVEGKGNHVGRFKGFSVDADGDLIIEADIDGLSCTC